MQYQGGLVLMKLVGPLLLWLEKSTYFIYLNLKHPYGNYSVASLFYLMDLFSLVWFRPKLG